MTGYTETDRLVIRPMRDTDESAFIRGISDAELRAMYGFPAEMDEDAASRIFRQFCGLRDAYALEEKNTGDMIGFLLDVAPELPEDISAGLPGIGRTLAYAVFPEYRRRGCMREVLREHIRQLFETTDTAYIHCGHFPENEPSEKLLRGLGFREYARHKAGKREIVDEVLKKPGVATVLRLGFAEVDITPDRPVELVGFYREDNRSKGVLKPLLAQAAVWETDERCCLITVDSIGFTKELTDALRERAGRILHVSPEKVMVCFSHTHAAPEADFEREYYEETCARIETAVSRALEDLEPAAAGWGNAKASIGVNRRKVSDATDDRIGILKACRAADGTPKLLVLRVSAHANVLKRDNCMISPDYFGDVRETAGKEFGCPVMVIQGAAGNTAPKYFCSAETPVDAAGSRYIRSKTALTDMARLITDSVKEIYGGILLREDCAVRMYSRRIRLESDVPAREEALRVAEEARTLCGIADNGWVAKVTRLNEAGVHVQMEDVEIQYLSVGDGCFCGGPYEFMVGFALEADKRLRNEFFYVNGYTNGNLLYFPTEDEFDAGGYEVFWSMLIYWPYVDRVYPFRRESASKLIRFMAENAPEGCRHSGEV